ncbi:MAG: DUF3775 domain-containing protein [Woeseiaceae bacterium]|jgi:hypothetical protein
MAEIELNRETVDFIIERAHEFHIRDDVEFDDEPDIASEDWSNLVTASFAADPAYQELKSTIDDLEPDQQVSLIALMWVGRGDFSIDEWAEALEEAADSWNENTADYLIGTSMLPDYLSEGLEAFDAG